MSAIRFLAGVAYRVSGSVSGCALPGEGSGAFLGVVLRQSQGDLILLDKGMFSATYDPLRYGVFDGCEARGVAELGGDLVHRINSEGGGDHRHAGAGGGAGGGEIAMAVLREQPDHTDRGHEQRRGQPRPEQVDGRIPVRGPHHHARHEAPVFERGDVGPLGALVAGAARDVGTDRGGHRGLSERLALVLQDIDGRQPRIPWIPAELDRVLTAIGELNRTLTPAPVEAPAAADSEAEAFTGWRTLRAARDAGQPFGRLDPWAVRHLDVLAEPEPGWAGPATGDSLAHGDLRADNILLADDRVVFVDWPHALRAAPWFDLLVMLPSVAAQGRPDPDTVFTTHPLGRAADPEGVNAVPAAVAGYFVAHSLMPDPPGLPTVRAFQGAQGTAAPAWLRGRLGRRTP